MCDEGAGVPYNASRAQRLRDLAAALSLDAIILISGFDGCYNLEAKGLVEWLCDCAAIPSSDFRAAALEEGLFVAMPNELAWHVEQDSDSMADDAVCALDRLLADPSAPAAVVPGEDTASDVDMQSAAATPTAAAAGHVVQELQQQQPQQQQLQHDTQLDGKLSLLLQLHPRLLRVGIALGVEVLGGVQQQVPVQNIFRWPLLMAAAEQLNLPMEQLFQEVVDITPTLRNLLGYADGTHLSNILRTRRPLLTRAWLETMGVCGRRSNTPKLDLTESGIAAPVTEFVSGCGCRLKPGQYQPLALPPRVLFGTRTSQQEALSCPTVSLRSQAAQQGCAVLHATLEAADACSPLRVARTIFFSQGAAAAETPLQLQLKPPPAQQQQQGDVDGSECRAAGQPAAAAAAAAVMATGVSNSGADRPGSSNADDGMCRCDSGSANNSAGTGCGPKQQQQAQQPSCQQQQEQQQQQQLPALPVGQALSNGDFDPDQTDLFDLMCWYWAAVDAAWQGMEYYATKEGATWPSAHAYASQVFWSSAAAAQLAPQQTEQPTPPQEQQPQQQWPHKPTLQLQLFSWDGGPRPMPSGADLQQHNSRVKTLRVTVSDIRSRSPAHPGMALGNVLYMDSFADVPAVGDCPPRLINLTLTHCPTNTFDLWGSEAALNTGRIAAFRRHLQLQLQSQLQAESQAAQAAALRRSADDSAVLRMQLQQGLKGGKGQRRASLPQQQQQLLLLQQLTAAGGGAGRGSTQQQQQRQQLLVQLQQQQQQQRGRGTGGGGNGNSSSSSSRQEAGSAGRGSKHSLGGSNSCCGEPEAAAAVPYHDSSNGQQALKRSCCGSSQQGSSGAAAPSGVSSVAGLLADLTAGPEGGPSPPAGTAAAAAAGGDAGGGGNGSSGGSSAAVAAAAVAAAQCWRQLGRLMVPPGEMPGEVALVLTGAMKLAVMDGPLYPHSSGLVLVSRPTKVHVLLLDQIEAVWLQDFAGRIPGYPDIGPCIVIKGKQPCCGLLPAVHMTDNNHMAIPLRAMSKVCSQHWVTAVLPAWQAAGRVVKASKGAAAPWPLPAEFQPFYTYWLQGPRKRYMLPQPDEELDQLVQVLDRPQHQQAHQVQG